MSHSSVNTNDKRVNFNRMFSKSFSNESRSLNSTPTKSSFRLAGPRVAHKHLPSFFGTNLFETSSFDTCKINTSSPLRTNSVVEKKSSAFEATRSNIFCRRYKSSYFESTTTTTASAFSYSNRDCNKKLLQEQYQQQQQQQEQLQQEYFHFRKHKNALIFNELEIRSAETKSVSSSSPSTSRTVAKAANKTMAASEGATKSTHSVVATKQAVDLLQHKRRRFSSKPKVFFKFALPDELMPSRR